MLVEISITVNSVRLGSRYQHDLRRRRHARATVSAPKITLKWNNTPRLYTSSRAVTECPLTPDPSWSYRNPATWHYRWDIAERRMCSQIKIRHCWRGSCVHNWIGPSSLWHITTQGAILPQSPLLLTFVWCTAHYITLILSWSSGIYMSYIDVN